MIPVGLTRRQSELLAFIRARLETSKVPPTFEEMRRHLGLGSKSGVFRLVEALVERGHLVRIRHRVQAIALPEDAASLTANHQPDPPAGVPHPVAVPAEPQASIQRQERGLRVRLSPALSRRLLTYCTERGADPVREISRALNGHIAGGQP